MVFYVKIWTRMASNKTISWSVTYEILTYFRHELGSASQIYVSTPRWFMSVFLLKSNDGTPQSIFFNVFIILKCSINRQNNPWHVKSWRITVEVLASQTCIKLYEIKAMELSSIFDKGPYRNIVILNCPMTLKTPRKLSYRHTCPI